MAHKDLNVDHSAKLRIIIGGGDLFLNPLKRIFRDVVVHQFGSSQITKSHNYPQHGLRCVGGIQRRSTKNKTTLSAVPFICTDLVSKK